MKDLSGLTLFQARILGLKKDSVILLSDVAHTVSGFRNQNVFYAKRVLPYKYLRPDKLIRLPAKAVTLLLAETDEERIMFLLRG